MRKQRITKKQQGRDLVKSFTVGVGEPKADGPVDTWWLVRAYNWYNTNVETKDAIGYLIEYLGNDPAARKIKPDSDDPTLVQLGYIARLKMREIEIPEKTKEFFKRELAAYTKPKTKFVRAVNKTIQDKLKDRNEGIIGLIEIELDKFSNTFKTDFSVTKLLQDSDSKAVAGKAIAEHFTPIMKEMAAALSKNDPELVEAYSCYSDAELKKFVVFMATLVKDAQSFAPVKVTKKGKEVKPKKINVAKNFEKLQYQRSFEKFKSIDPLNIHGAKMLWVYNSKYGKLGFYIATGDEKLSVKGTSITGFDEAKSFTRTIRKPVEIETKLSPKDIPGKDLAVFFAAQKTAISPIRSRIGEDTILLKVVR